MDHDSFDVARAHAHLAKRYPDGTARQQLLKTVRLANVLATNVENFRGLTDWVDELQRDIARLQATVQDAPKLDLRGLQVDTIGEVDLFKKVRAATGQVEAASSLLAKLQLRPRMFVAAGNLVRGARLTNTKTLAAAASVLTLSRKGVGRPSPTDLLAAAMIAGVEPASISNSESRRETWKKALKSAHRLLDTRTEQAAVTRLAAGALTMIAAIWQVCEALGQDGLRKVFEEGQRIPTLLLLECIPPELDQALTLRKLHAAGRESFALAEIAGLFGMELPADTSQPSASRDIASPVRGGEKS